MPLQSLTLCSGQQVKLGRIRPRKIYRLPGFVVQEYANGKTVVMPELSRYYNARLDQTPPPPTIDYTQAGMASIKRVYLNDQYGDCVIASKYHEVGVWSGNETGTAVLADDSEVANSYHTICGPGDNGCIISDVFDYFKATGLKFSGQLHKIDGYVALDWTNQQLTQVALEIFGSICIGVNLPSGWTCTNCIWGPSSGMVGGHDVSAFACSTDPNALKDATGKPFGQAGVVIATWGGLALIPWQQWTSKQFIEEAWVPLSPDWYSKGNLAPNGINAQALADDLQKIAQGQIPDVPPPGPTVIDFDDL